MRVRLLVSLASAGGSFGKGTSLDLPADEALRFIQDGLAVSDEDDKPVESAIIKPKAEKAVSKKHGGV